MAETKTRTVEVTVAILLAVGGAVAVIGVFEAQEHHDAVGWFTACAASFVAAALIPIAVFIFFPWIERLNTRQQSSNAKPTKQYQRPEKAIESTEKASDSNGNSSESTADRIFVNVTPNYLADFYDKLTGYEADISVSRYINKWMNISGQLDDLSTFPSGTDSFVVVLERADMMDPVTQLIFDPKWFPRLEVLRRGDSITVIGRIAKVATRGVVLRDCELVAS